MSPGGNATEGTGEGAVWAAWQSQIVLTRSMLQHLGRSFLAKDRWIRPHTVCFLLVSSRERTRTRRSLLTFLIFHFISILALFRRPCRSGRSTVVSVGAGRVKKRRVPRTARGLAGVGR